MWPPIRRCVGDSLSLPRHCCSPHPANCAIWRRSAATSCNARAAPISATRPIAAAINGARAPAARPCMASIEITRFSDGPKSCVATNPSDLAVALAAMDAIVIVRGKTGERLIPFTDFHRLPGSTPERDNVLDRGDLIIAIEVPANAEASASHYLKVRDRASYEFALVSTAAAVATDGRRIRSARLATGGVAHKPWRLTAAETGLRGISLDDIDGLRSAIALSFTDARPLAQNAFKVELAQRVALRALQTAGART
jgi:CO/xanthine dehydrogenase FAD-binding subunit